MIELKITDHAEIKVQGSGDTVLNDIMMSFSALTMAAMKSCGFENQRAAFRALSEYYITSDYSESDNYKRITVDAGLINKLRKDKE